MKVLQAMGLAGLFLGMGALGVVSVAAAAPEYQTEDDLLKKTDHRFQIFIAEHNSILNGKPVSMKSIFKIDLETGTVWRYRQGVDSKGKPFEEFFEVPNQ